MKYTRALKSDSKMITIFGLLIAAFLLLVLTGCQNPFRSDSRRSALAAGYGTLSLTIGGKTAFMARTIMPDTTLNDFDGFYLDFVFQTDSGENFSIDDWAGGFKLLELAAGTWELHVTAFMGYDEYDEPREAASGFLEFTIISGQNAAHNVNLHPIEDGYGTFHWDISFSDNVHNAWMEITRISYDYQYVNSFSETFFFVVNGTPEKDTYYSLLLPAGRYRVIFTLYNDRDESVTISEVLHIYTNLESRFSKEFAEEYFTIPLINLILRTWAWNDDDNEYRWHLIEEGFMAEYFYLLGIRGVYSSNFADIVYWFNELSASSTIPVDEAGLKVLVDAARISIAGANDAFILAHYGNRPGAIEAITELVRNSTFIYLDWTDDNTVTIDINYGDYEVVITFLPGLSIPETATTFAEQLAWLRTNAQSGNTYFIELNDTDSITSAAAGLPTGRSNLTIRLVSTSGVNNINLSGTGVLFTIGNGVTLILGEGITLHGNPANSNHLVRVDSGGNLIMNPGSRITGNLNTTNTIANAGGGVRVNSAGTFTMYGGEISGNNTTGTAADVANGAGVRVETGGMFNMRGGTIYGNVSTQNGGGVHNAGTFRISSGIIYGTDAAADMNMAPTGASLNNVGTAQRGTFTAGVFTSTAALPTTNLTIHVVNGTLQIPIALSLTNHFAWLRDFAQSGENYLIELSGNETIAPTTDATGAGQILPTGRTNLTITLRGSGGRHFIDPSDNGSLFWIPSGVTLVLDNDITLIGRGGNTNHLLRVTSGGNLVMNTGAIISNNTNTTGTGVNGGGGVRVNSGGTFTMNDGQIVGHSTVGDGGGVHVELNGMFNMRGGTISLNAAQNGGGVSNAGTFRISSGIIHSTTAAGDANTAEGSGASLSNTGTAQFGTFDGDVFTQSGILRTNEYTITLINASLQRPARTGDLAAQLAWLRLWATDPEYIITLSDSVDIVPAHAGLPTGLTNLTIRLQGTGAMRTISLYDTGVLFTIDTGVTLALDSNITLRGHANNNNHLVRVNSGGTLIMNTGSRITDNTNITTSAADGGGGVRVNSGGTFTMNGGEISGNSTTSTAAVGNGGGVRLEGGRFYMHGGTIFGNTAQAGGGVHVANIAGSTFRMFTGIIHGNEPTLAEELRNTSRAATTASLNNAAGITAAQHGILDIGGAFLRLGDLPSGNTTLNVLNGMLQ